MNDTVKRGVDILTSNVCVLFGEDGKGVDLETVIDSYELFVTNKLRQQAADLE